VFPSFSRDGTLAVTDFESKLANPSSSISVMAADGSNRRRVFGDFRGAAYSPAWSPDGQWLVFGFGGFLNARNSNPGKIVRVRADGSRAEDLTQGVPNAGFPNWSADGKRIVYRVWGGDQRGLRILFFRSAGVTLEFGGDITKFRVVKLWPSVLSQTASWTSRLPSSTSARPRRIEPIGWTVA